MEESTVNTSHSSQIHDIQIDFFGRLMATCSSDGLIKIFDNTTKQEICTLRGHSKPVIRIAWSHTGFLASVGADSICIVWKENRGNWIQLKKYDGFKGPLIDVCWEGDELILACIDGTVWKISKEGQKTSINAHMVSCTCVASQGSVLITGGGDGLVKKWDNGQLVETWKGHIGWVRSVAISGSLIASGGDDGKVRIWEPSIKKIDAESPIQKVQFDVGGTILAASTTSSLLLWKDEDGEWVQMI